jgi:hypothetical protein
MPNARARRAISRPMLPYPTIVIVLPRSDAPSNATHASVHAVGHAPAS